jgi:hypothetical protein
LALADRCPPPPAIGAAVSIGSGRGGSGMEGESSSGRGQEEKAIKKNIVVATNDFRAYIFSSLYEIHAVFQLNETSLSYFYRILSIVPRLNLHDAEMLFNYPIVRITRQVFLESYAE